MFRIPESPRELCLSAGFLEDSKRTTDDCKIAQVEKPADESAGSADVLGLSGYNSEPEALEDSDEMPELCEQVSFDFPMLEFLSGIV